jgi:hypothetical protein
MERQPRVLCHRQACLAATRLAGDLIAAGAGDASADAKAELAAGFALDALAPTNFLLTKLAAVKHTLETGGASLVADARNFVDDVISNGGRPRQVEIDTTGRCLGRCPDRGDAVLVSCFSSPSGPVGDRPYSQALRTSSFASADGLRLPLVTSSSVAITAPLPAEPEAQRSGRKRR